MFWVLSAQVSRSLNYPDVYLWYVQFQVSWLMNYISTKAGQALASIADPRLANVSVLASLGSAMEARQAPTWLEWTLVASC